MRRRDYCRFGPFRVGIIPQGLLKPFILKLLSERPMQLEEEGYIEPVITQHQEGKSTKGGGEKSRRPYRISKKGTEVLKDYERFRKEWLENVSQLRRIWL
jgi:hypothetical protein